MIICIGADIGQKRDPTAIVVCEYEVVEIDEGGVPHDPTGLRDLVNIATGVEDPPLLDTRYVVRALERLPLETPYPTVARRLHAICRAMARRPKAEVFLAVDATGVGRPIVDLVRDELDDGVHLTAVTISGGEKCPQAPLYRSEITMGKVFMVSRLQALLQSRRIVMPKKSLDAQGLATELLDFEIRVGRDAHAEMGAFKTGTHDDLVTALGLSVLGDDHNRVRYGPSLY